MFLILFVPLMLLFVTVIVFLPAVPVVLVAGLIAMVVHWGRVHHRSSGTPHGI